MPITKQGNKVSKCSGGNTSIEAGVMPLGKYYVGDLSYVLSDGGTWEEVNILRLKDRKRRANFSTAGGGGQGKFTLSNGREIVIFDTAYGDGVYDDYGGRRYAVDSGSIGLTLAEGLENTQHGNLIEYKEAFNCGALIQDYRCDGSPRPQGRFTFMSFGGHEAGIETGFR